MVAKAAGWLRCASGPAAVGDVAQCTVRLPLVPIGGSPRPARREQEPRASGKYQRVRGGVVVSITKVAIRVLVRSDTSSAVRLSLLVRPPTVAHCAGW